MYSSPVHATSKPGTDTFYLINDQSAGDFSPNSMIHLDEVACTCMYEVKFLKASLHAHCKLHGNLELVMFNSDIQEAYLEFRTVIYYRRDKPYNNNYNTRRGR